MINDTLQNRRYVISIIMSAVIVVYILRLFTIQIIDTKYKNGADYYMTENTNYWFITNRHMILL